MKPEYDSSNGRRGEYASRYAQGTNVILLDADVYAVFTDSLAVNEALRTLIRVTHKARRYHCCQKRRAAHSPRGQSLPSASKR